MFFKRKKIKQNNLKGIGQEIGDKVQEAFVISTVRGQKSLSNVRSYVNEWGNHHIYTAITLIAESVRKKKWHIEKNGKIIENHRLIPVFQKPNQLHTWGDLIYLTVSALEATGNGYWYLQGDNVKNPDAIYFIPPDKVSIIVGENTPIKGYMLTLGGTRKAVLAERILHFK